MPRSTDTTASLPASSGEDRDRRRGVSAEPVAQEDGDPAVGRRDQIRELVAVDVHDGQVVQPVAEAGARLMNEAFQEEGEAVGKWKRAQLTSAQLTTYFYGFTEMMALRTQLKKAPGFTERAYHDKLLKFASPSMRHIRAIMTSAER